MSVEAYLSVLLKIEVGQITTYDLLREISKIWHLL